ncbi:MAG: amino acid ABC transporter permease [Propionibacteriaceae bacterium]|jgi:polar amino acid transport system permease protein|nr:amino acid ABC transporter permease [Propionibacteriaceae bacterium]
MMTLNDIRPTVRRRIARVTSYVVFLALVVVVIATADWGIIVDKFFNPMVTGKMWPGILRAALNTVLYTLISFAVGLVAAVVFALMKMSKGPFRWFATVYIEIFRGIPAMLTIFIMALGMPIAFNGLKFPGGTTGGGLVGLMLVTSAYTAEIIRSGIVAVPKGQREAARSLGMSHMRTTVTVILPQAFRIVIPPLTNEIVMLLKDTSLLGIVGATMMSKELTFFGRDGMTTYGNPTPLFVAAVIYLIITIPLTYVVSRLEKRMAVKK